LPWPRGPSARRTRLLAKSPRLDLGGRIDRQLDLHADLLALVAWSASGLGARCGRSVGLHNSVAGQRRTSWLGSSRPRTSYRRHDEVPVANERLRAAILASGLGIQATADAVGVDRKTIERWISGRTPYRRHQYALASLLAIDLPYLWPDSRPTEEVSAMGQAEVVAIYPHRSVVPSDLWMTIFQRAADQLDVLAFSAFWLSEDRTFHQLLRDKAKAGVAVRMLFGDPDSPELAQRGEDEGIGAAMAAKVRNAILN